MMVTLENYGKLLDFVINTPSLTFIVFSLAILSISVSVSAFDNLWFRFAFVVVLAAVMGYLASIDPSPAWRNYFTNISAELIGAFIAAMLLGVIVMGTRLLFPVVLLAISASFLPMELADEGIKPFLMELNSEIVGAFVLYVLLEKRHVIWNSAKRARERRLKRLKREKDRLRKAYRETYQEELSGYERHQQRLMTRQLHSRKAAIARDVQRHIEQWHRRADCWDVAIIITGSNRQDINQKCKRLARTFQDFEVIKVVEDQATETAECCIVASVEPIEHDSTNSSRKHARPLL